MNCNYSIDGYVSCPIPKVIENYLNCNGISSSRNVSHRCPSDHIQVFPSQGYNNRCRAKYNESNVYTDYQISTDLCYYCPPYFSHTDINTCSRSGYTPTPVTYKDPKCA
jgi:hypothetical protein